MSVIAFGDLHTTKDELRVLTVLNFLDYITDYCKNNPEIKSVINLGDLFDRPELKSQAFVPVFRKLLELSKIVHIYSIIGNHELKDKEGNDTLIETFSSFGTFIQNNATLEVDGLGMADFMSYTDDISNIPNKSPILFGHLEIKGFWFNPHKQIENSIMEKSNFDQYQLVVSGHLHHEQHDETFKFVGSPFETNKGEMGKKNYFAVIDENLNYNLIEYEDAPKYMIIDAEDFNENLDYNNKMLTVRINKKIENFVKLRDILMSKGALSIDAEFIKEEIEDTAEHKIDTNEGVVKSAARYLNDIKTDGIDNKKLLACFKEVLSRI